MRIDVITLFPESMEDLTGVGVTGRAIRNGKVELKAWNPRDWADDRHRTVDDRPYGGGPGMVMAVEPLSSAIRAVRKEQAAGTAVSLMSPQGRTLDQAGIEDLAGRQG
ncbi:MAG: tRNA (guanosine(37)-N1)-methyltransferase TrmD, partial [Gammaproteobacteria bacterium]|nr:tRNA (guanosine(37)-N1)-methyltransferase TrmD [Gammaproteobacteria bacterium]